MGQFQLRDALKLAEDKGMDLVEVAPQAVPPVCKLLDYGKFKYELNKKEREAKQNRKTQELKEIKFRLKIDEHDLSTKIRTIQRMLKDGDKIKCVIMFRGREMVYTAQGIKLMERVAQEAAEFGTIERIPKLEGRNMIMILAPK